MTPQISQLLIAHRLGLSLASAVVLVSVTLGAAFAQDQTNNPRYKNAISQYETAARQDKHEEAAEALRRALSISPQPEKFYDVAELYERAQKKRLALKYYLLFVDQAPADGRVAVANNKIAQLKEALKGSYEEVMITSQPPKAYLYVNERAKGVQCVTPCRLKLLPGNYNIIAELEDHVPAEQMLKLEQGSTSQLLLTLYKESEVAPVSFLINQPGASVYVDRRKRGESPLMQPLLIRQGLRELRVSKPGYKTWVKRINLKAQQPTTVDVELKAVGMQDLTARTSSSSGSALPWIVMGTGAALLGGSVYTGMSAQGLYGDLEARRDQRQLIAPQDITVGNRYVLFTNVLMGLGITSLATGSVLWVLEPSGAPKTTTDARFAEGSDGLERPWDTPTSPKHDLTHVNATTAIGAHP